MQTAQNLLALWGRFKHHAIGRWFFSKLLGKMVPYSGTIHPEILLLEAGSAEVKLQDRRIVRNHLRSIHALALANLGEISTGLALHSVLPKTHRAILLSLQTTYLKKARGTLIAKSRCSVTDWPEDGKVEMHSKTFDSSDVVVSETKTVWKVSHHPS